MAEKTCLGILIVMNGKILSFKNTPFAGCVLLAEKVQLGLRILFSRMR
jgi:hypothetical protein